MFRYIDNLKHYVRSYKSLSFLSILGTPAN